jgi:hypothetical protein
MKKLIDQSKGSSKKQLTNVLKTKEDDFNDLEEYITEGRKYLKTLDEKVEALRSLQKGLEEGKSIAEINHESEKKVQAEKSETEKKVEVAKQETATKAEPAAVNSTQ